MYKKYRNAYIRNAEWARNGISLIQYESLINKQKTFTSMWVQVLIIRDRINIFLCTDFDNFQYLSSKYRYRIPKNLKFQSLLIILL